MDLEEAYRRIWTGKMVGIKPPDQQSIDRVTWTAKMFTPAMKGEALLDIGTGSGAMLHAAQSAGMHPIGIDFDELVVAWLGTKGYRVHRFDMNRDVLPFEAGHFGVITSCDVIEHLTDPDHMLAETFRLLKPGGKAFIATPNCSYWERVKSLAGGTMFKTSGDKYLKDGGHLAYYGPEDFVEAIGRAGFSNRVILHLFNKHEVPTALRAAFRGLGVTMAWAEHTYMIAEATK